MAKKKTDSFQWSLSVGGRGGVCRDFLNLTVVGFSGLKQKWDRSATELSVLQKTSQIAVKAKEDNRPLTSLTLWRNRKSLVGRVERVDRCN